VRAMAQAWPALAPVLHQRTRLLLGDLDDRRSFASRLNNDGSPLQICISAGPTATAAHLIADPGSDEPDASAHHARGMACVLGVTSGQTDDMGRDAVARCIAMNLPADPAAAGELAVGTIWLGLPIQGPGLTVYLNAAWGARAAQWERVAAWLHAEGVPAALSQSAIGTLRPIARPVSIGLDVLSGAPLRLKVYFRLTRAVKLDAFSDPAWTSEAVLDFLQETVRDRRLPPSGLVFCAEFLRDAAHLVGIKVDVCAHCLRYDVRDWVHVLPRISGALGTLPFQMACWAAGQDAEIAVVGVGRRIDGEVRCNLYLKGRA
jgi:hypothetical protein